MIPYKIGDLSFSLPTSYGELTLKQFIDLIEIPDDENYLDVISILSGVDKKVLSQCEILEIDHLLSPFIEFLQEPLKGEFVLPDNIQIAGIWYPKPSGIGINTFGQKISLQRAITKSEKEERKEYEIYAYIIALYIQPAVTKSAYDEDKVDELVPEIMNCRISEVFPIASFFLKNYETYLNSKKKDYHIHPLVMKLGQALTDSQSLQNSQRFGRWRRPLIKLLKRCFSKSIPLST